MRDHFEIYGVLYVIVGLIISFILLVFGLAVWGEYLQANAMRELGYETKVVNLDCYAKYQDRWLACKAVANNQVQITH